MITLKNILLTGLAALTLASCGKSDLEQMAEIAQKVPELRLVKDFQINYQGKDALSGELTPKKGNCLSLPYDSCSNTSPVCDAGVNYGCIWDFSEDLTLLYHGRVFEEYVDGNKPPVFGEFELDKRFREAIHNKQKLDVTFYTCERINEDNSMYPKSTNSSTVIYCNYIFLKPTLDACWPEEKK